MRGRLIKRLTEEIVGCRGACPACYGLRDRPGYSYCRECHNRKARTSRRSYRNLSPDERAKANARSYANTYQRRGFIVPRKCGEHPEKHHEDYTFPLAFKWIDRSERRRLHADGRGTMPPPRVRDEVDEAIHRVMLASLHRVKAARDDIEGMG